ncbi:mannose-1-phosphate guanylyltransferase/mannose-6-phosphate isomerase [Allofrancisella guangzhouensis]|uniref:mannose-1-phosphate guanylyltransferase n=1 Tax=Allofrancisella guangzhouensis TaxID=594679 RepID=A0A0A8E5F1_9GAMM|nr:mannose-1-phosphate guanylyltransferase/mannose-6-phosphate isomerase [Allofrancisella guangzhouensis]AJC48832.1 mannose-6-phosphate isomerase [Allofrancisella guangzhouensis]MBK2027271.1 mannose-1-phosphate guanylyltransferase/mannose-6-phosphate isomerase [Allofrancisella guangzhouensis]MBK2044725.1 mannose-1-phosphate guanylyltransferase/mannose-6-phosphate isomerase [Allofrancisella guangzhouensis]MBK2045933.1 mannose-1-phosphate guanylyltransferase/mannose-6-phosphate isomerase [Allofra
MINIVLCGGSGTRLWPLSRTLFPKQFVRLFNGKSLFQETLLRNSATCEKTLIVSNVEQYFLALDQIREINLEVYKYILEPIARNTAPAIALACLALNADDIVLITPSDHLIKNQNAYQKALLEAKELASQGNIVTFGIKPIKPETGYGYIHANGTDVLSFKEKPDFDTAKKYIEEKNYFWNAGIFCCKAGVYLEELKKYAEEIYYKSEKAFNGSLGHEVRIDGKAMLDIPSDSIDYAVIENSSKVKMVQCENIDWSDLGSFDSLDEQIHKDVNGNSIVKADEVKEPVFLNSTNNLLVTESRQVSMIDINNLLVIDTADALLIARKGSSQGVKKILEKVSTYNPELAEKHTLVFRPWGNYRVLINSVSYKVKKIVLNPKSKLSLQKHQQRNEHWVVLSGIATVTLEDEIFKLRKNESTYITAGQKHRLENQQNVPLIIIEIQVGGYVSEDDIISFGI